MNATTSDLDDLTAMYDALLMEVKAGAWRGTTSAWFTSRVAEIHRLSQDIAGAMDADPATLAASRALIGLGTAKPFVYLTDAERDQIEADVDAFMDGDEGLAWNPAPSADDWDAGLDRPTLTDPAVRDADWGSVPTVA